MGHEINYMENRILDNGGATVCLSIYSETSKYKMSVPSHFSGG